MEKRKTIGLLIHDLDGNYQTYFWHAVKKAAERFDVNLIVYEGRVIKCRYDADKQHHIMYDFIDRERVDGLIITTATISNYIEHEESIAFCRKYMNIPCISIGVEIPGVTSILSDNKEGMKSLIRHLINDHCYKKIAFVTGTENNLDSIERFEAYKEVLTESGIEFDAGLVIKGDFIYSTGYSIMGEIIQEGIEYDAIIFANDDMALGAIQCAKDYSGLNNIDYCKKYTICGFDDSINSGRVKPSLTTVRQPLTEMAFGAMKLILKKLDGEAVDDVIVYPSVLIKRESCGCKCEIDYDFSSINLTRVIPRFRAHENVQTYILEELFERVSHSLKRCQIKGCFISLYEEGPIFYDTEKLFDEKFNIPEKSELIYAYNNDDEVKVDNKIKLFKTKNIVPNCFIPEDRRFIYLVDPLFFGNEHLGFVCFEIVNDDIINFEPIRGQISNSLKVATMLSERERMEASLKETERLSYLGQLIGGISHNLMSPIMSISGACVGLEDLLAEYEESIGDSTVTSKDHYEIVSEMREWIRKLKEYNMFMSSSIATIKRQVVQLNNDSHTEFSIGEFVNTINFVRNHNVNIKKSRFNFYIDVEDEIKIEGGISNLTQVIINIFLNALQAYEKDERNRIIDFHILRRDNSILFIVKDYGRGMSDDVKNKFFKRMVTTKGKQGTGISMLLSYSTIKGKYRGEMWFESEEGKGTSIYISIPFIKQ